MKQQTKKLLNHNNKKQAATEALGGKCQICSYNRYNGALHFHHINPEDKEYNFCQIWAKPWSIIKKELEKCVLLCSNCHNELHGNIIQLPQSYTKYDENLIKTDYTLFESKRKIILFLDRDWKEIQKYYDTTLCDTRSLCLKFHISTEAIAKADRLKLFVYRRPWFQDLSPELLKSIAKKSKSLTEIFKFLFISRGGNNGPKLKELIEKYNIDISHFKNISKDRIKF